MVMTKDFDDGNNRERRSLMETEKTHCVTVKEFMALENMAVDKANHVLNFLVAYGYAALRKIHRDGRIRTAYVFGDDLANRLNPGVRQFALEVRRDEAA